MTVEQIKTPLEREQCACVDDPGLLDKARGYLGEVMACLGCAHHNLASAAGQHRGDKPDDIIRRTELLGLARRLSWAAEDIRRIKESLEGK